MASINGIDIAGFFSGILEDIRLVLSDPTADATLTLVVVAMLLLVLAFFGAIGYLIYSYTTRDRLRIQVKVPVSESAYDIWFQRLVIIGIIVASGLAASYYVGQPKFCANCHSKKQEANALAKSPHADIKCLKCHQSPGISGAAMQKLDYSRWFWVYATTNKAEPKKAYVDDSSCLKCHGEIRQKTVSRYAIRVSHKEFLNAGASCMDCHNQVAHAGVVKLARTPGMSSCVKCHNDKIAKADCALCHKKDFGEKMRTLKRDQVKTGIFVGWDFCYRCHQVEKCTRCHGVQMPHPPGWVTEGQHARPAFTNRNVCWRCHDAPDRPLQPAQMQGCPCHGSMGYHGSTDSWRQLHGPIATGQVLGDGENQYCGSCHGEGICDICHTKGKYKAPTG